jgi:UDP-3-O-[3-hydroxymyristoyl] glucosamine N-acyltransferase
MGLTTEVGVFFSAVTDGVVYIGSRDRIYLNASAENNCGITRQVVLVPPAVVGGTIFVGQKTNIYTHWTHNSAFLWAIPLVKWLFPLLS